jgi:hypothetical protein
MNRRLTHPVDITIRADWPRVVSLFDEGLAILKTQPERITKQYKYSDYGYHYEINNVLFIGKITNGSPEWNSLNGPLVASIAPWLQTMMDDMQELNPISTVFNRMVGTGLEHVDQANTLTSLNYFITDGTAVTTVRDGDYTETYPTKKDQGWLLDIQKPHKIDNTETRIWFTIRFGETFDRCREWFKDHPGLVYGK